MSKSCWIFIRKTGLGKVGRERNITQIIANDEFKGAFFQNLFTQIKLANFSSVSYLISFVEKYGLKNDEVKKVFNSSEGLHTLKYELKRFARSGRVQDIYGISDIIKKYIINLGALLELCDDYTKECLKKNGPESFKCLIR